MAKTSSRLGRGLGSLIAGGTTPKPVSSSEVTKPSGVVSIIPDTKPDSPATPKIETDANTTEKLGGGFIGFSCGKPIPTQKSY